MTEDRRIWPRWLYGPKCGRALFVSATEAPADWLEAPADGVYADMASPESGWPRFFYGPEGTRGKFAAAIDVPEGWTDTPDAVDAPAEIGAIPLTRKQIVAELRKHKVEFPKDATDTHLYELLLEYAVERGA